VFIKFRTGHLMKFTRPQFACAGRIIWYSTECWPFSLTVPLPLSPWRPYKVNVYRLMYTFNMSSLLPTPCGMNSDSVDKINESTPIIQDHLIPHQYDPIKCAIHLICAAFGIPLNVFVGAVLISRCSKSGATEFLHRPQQPPGGRQNN
jgi:hypothetical protein